MTDRPVRIGLMGFGRIGRNLFRQLRGHPTLEISHIVDIADPEGLTYLLKYDSIYGRFPTPVTLEGNTLNIAGKSSEFRQEREPGEALGGSWGRGGRPSDREIPHVGGRQAPPRRRGPQGDPRLHAGDPG